jgi:hypothetical protein
MITIAIVKFVQISVCGTKLKVLIDPEFFGIV